MRGAVQLREEFAGTEGTVDATRRTEDENMPLRSYVESVGGRSVEDEGGRLKLDSLLRTSESKSFAETLLN